MPAKKSRNFNVNTVGHHARCAHVTSQQNQDIGILKTPNFDLAKFKRCSKGAQKISKVAASAGSGPLSCMHWWFQGPHNGRLFQSVPDQFPIEHVSSAAQSFAATTLPVPRFPLPTLHTITQSFKRVKGGSFKRIDFSLWTRQTPGEFLTYLIVPIVELHWSDRLTDLCGLFFSFFSIFARVQWHLVALIDTKNIHWDVCTCLSVSQRLCFYTIMTFSWLSSLVETWKTAPSGTWSLKCHSAGIDLSRVASSCSGVKGARTATGLRVLQV